MIKLFFVTFFIAELVIALAIISKVYGFNKCVNNWNNLVLSNKDSLKTDLAELRSSVTEFSQSVDGVKVYIQQKRKEYTLTLLQTTLTYLGIFTLRGKYKKAILTYQLLKELYEGISEV